MALAATAVIECRTTGSATNGGSYNPSRAGVGVDFSQQDAAQISVTDAVANGTTTVTSATAGFVAGTGGHTGNGVYIGSSWYEITSVTNTTTIVVDRTITAGSGLTLKVGGAIDHPATMGGVIAVNGITLHVKAGTYLHGSTANVSGGRLNVAAALKIYGYTTTRGDDAPTRPVMEANASSITLWIIGNVGTTFCRVRGIDFYRNTGGGLTSVSGLSTGQAVLVEKCRVRNMNATGGGFLCTSTVGSSYTDCDAVGCATGFASSITGTRYVRCVAVSCTTNGFTIGGTTATANAVMCVAASCGVGFVSSGPVQFVQCTAYGSTTVGFSGSAAFNTTAVNCLAVSCGTYGFFSSPRLVDCAGYNNTNGNYDNAGGDGVEGFVTLSADPFTNAAGLDFSLNSTAGGGAACKQISYAYPGLSTTSYPDIGAAQAAASSSGGMILSRVFTGF